MNTAEWGESLKVGDEVAVVSEYGTVTRIHKVTRVTKAQFVAGTRTFWRKNGDVVGGGKFTSVAAYEPMPHHRGEAAEQQKVKFVLRAAHWARLSPGAQKQIAELTLKLMANEGVTP